MDWAVIIVLLVINGLFAMSEIAVLSARKVRLEQAAERGDAGAASALALARSPTKFLSTVQIGITAIGIFAGAFGQAALAKAIEEPLSRVEWIGKYAGFVSLGIVVVILTYLSLVIGELIPKRIGVSHPEGVARRVARPMSWLAAAFSPLVWLLSASTDIALKVLGIKGGSEDSVSEEEIRGMVQKGTESGVIHETEQDIVERVFRFGDRRVKSLMVPRGDIVWIDVGASLERVRLVVATSPHSHFPVCDGGLDKIVGVIHVKDVLKTSMVAGDEVDLRAIVRAPLFVPEAAQAIKVLESFRHGGEHIAFVVDEFGGVEGLLTLNDLVSAIVGEVATSQRGQDPDAVRREDGSWLVDGRMALSDMFHTLEADDPPMEEVGDVTTVSGLVFALLGRLPRKGDVVDRFGLRFEVLDMDGRRVDQVLVKALEAPEGGEVEGREEKE